MSYLDPPRLHFAGRFQASPSTVNNDPIHYDNDRFCAAYQMPQSGKGRDKANGWWNPDGDGAWRLIGCRVTSVRRRDDRPTAPDDPVLRCLVADSDRTVAAKIVDLDPEQQLASEIWGMEVRVCDPSGLTLLRGRFVAAAFMDIWDRSAGGGGDSGAGAMFQSVLTDVEWIDVDRSPFLKELNDAAGGGPLSIKFNVDGYQMNPRASDFTLGRVVGTIGTAAAEEPRHFVLGRQFMPKGLPGGRFFAPAGGLNFCAAVLDRGAGKVRLDLGNALPMARSGGEPMDLGPLGLVGLVAQNDGSTTPLPIGNIRYTEPRWYEDTAGVVDLPADRRLGEAELDVLAGSRLQIQRPGPDGSPVAAVSEPAGGVFVRPDAHVFRLDPGEAAEVSVYATQYGAPYQGASVLAFRDPGVLQIQASSALGKAPPVAVPPHAIDMPVRVVTDARGRAVLKIKAGNPRAARGYIDGQVYGVRAALEETLSPTLGYPFNPWLFVSLLVFDPLPHGWKPTWHGGIGAIFRQYANLYPVMKRFLDLGSYAEVCKHRALLAMAFGLDPSDPNSMPVSRDLSKAKRAAILDWLQGNPPEEGKPPRRHPTPPEPGPAGAPEAMTGGSSNVSFGVSSPWWSS